MNFRWKTVGAKQNGDNERWLYVWKHITALRPQAYIEQLVEQSAQEVKQFVIGKKTGYAWSGGKDSQALRVVMERAGIQRCVLAMTSELEYPEFLQWATDNMPHGLDIIETGQDLRWLAQNQDMLFPQDAKTAAKWFKVIQHTAQDLFFQRYHLDLIILGRRHADRNYTGEDGVYTTSKGTTRYSPIREWSHEDVMGVCYWYDMPLAPFYNWVNGWVVGTGCWPARQWTGSVENGWREVYSIDQSVVRKAASYISSAAHFLNTV